MKTPILKFIVSLLFTGAILVTLALIFGFEGGEKAQNEARNAAAIAMQELNANQQAREYLGFPFTQSELSTQAIDLGRFGSEATVRLSFMVTGPNGAGKALCSLSRRRGEAFWRLENAMFFPQNGPPISIRGRR